MRRSRTSSTVNAGISQFYGGANGGNLPTIGSPLSAFNTVFGGMLPTGTTASSLMARRQSILDLIKNEATTLSCPTENRPVVHRDGHAGGTLA